MIFGGEPGNGAALASTALFDLSTNQWVTGPLLNSARYGAAAVTVGNYVITTGGRSGAGLLQSTEATISECYGDYLPLNVKVPGAP